MQRYMVQITGQAIYIIDVEAENEIEAKGKALALLDNSPNLQPEDVEIDREWEDITALSDHQLGRGAKAPAEDMVGPKVT